MDFNPNRLGIKSLLYRPRYRNRSSWFSLRRHWSVVKGGRLNSHGIPWPAPRLPAVTPCRYA